MAKLKTKNGGIKPVVCYDFGTEPWMYCIVFAPEDKAPLVKEMYDNAISDFMNDEDGSVCYGDLLEDALSEAGIPHYIIYPPYDYGEQEEDTPDYTTFEALLNLL